MVKLAEGKNVIVETGIEQDFKMTPAQLEAAITPKTKLLILCSPSNPTGSVYSREELEALASVLERHPQVFVISDEIYEHINYVGAHQSLAQFPLYSRADSHYQRGFQRLCDDRLAYRVSSLLRCGLPKPAINCKDNTHREHHLSHRKPQLPLLPESKVA